MWQHSLVYEDLSPAWTGLKPNKVIFKINNGCNNATQKKTSFEHPFANIFIYLSAASRTVSPASAQGLNDWIHFSLCICAAQRAVSVDAVTYAKTQR